MSKTSNNRKENYKRYISKPGVREKRLEYYKNYYQENKEDRRSYFKEYNKKRKAQRRASHESTNNM